MAENLHKVMNEFDKLFGKKHGKIKWVHFKDNHITIAFEYVPFGPIPESNRNKEYWNKYNNPEESSESIGVKLELKTDELTGKQKLILWRKEGIYTNSCIMPDCKLAEKFFAAKKEWTGDRDWLMAGFVDISLTGKLKETICKMAVKQTEMLVECIKYHMTKDTEDEIKKISNYANQIKAATDVRMYLMKQ